MTTTEPAPAKSRAGRNLPAAIGVGLALGAVALSSLFFDRRWFLLLAAAAMVTAVLVLTGALRHADIRLPAPPLVLGVVGVIAAGWFAGGGRAATAEAWTFAGEWLSAWG